MKYCEKCGRELLDEAVICPGCGCAVNGAAQKARQNSDEAGYSAAVSSANTMLWGGTACFVVGIIAFLAISIYVGSALCVVAALLYAMPMNKLRNAVKERSGADKEAFKAELKQADTQVSNQSSAYRTTKILRILAAVIGIITLFFW